jgi:spoIIIJ-associated protein
MPDENDEEKSPKAENDEHDTSWSEPQGGEASSVKVKPSGDQAVPDNGEADPTIAKNGTMEVYDEARADSARDFVEDLMTKMGMEVMADLVEPEPGDPPGEIRIEIEGRDSGRIIGKKGQVLSAIQHIVNRVVNRPGLDRCHVVVDAEGYRQRREDTLATMAQRLGQKALEEGKIITFEPMSPRDRRIVHLALAKFPGVVTKSDGEGEGRRVQIIPVRR